MNADELAKELPRGYWIDDQDDPLDPDLLNEFLDRLHVPRRSPKQGK